MPPTFISNLRFTAARALAFSVLCVVACGESHREDPIKPAGRAADSGEAGRSSEAGRAGASASDDTPNAGQSSMGSARDTTFELRNEGEAALVLGSTCGANWLAISEQGRESVIDSSCLCMCDSTAACGCGFICSNTQQVVVPGTSVSLAWDGVVRDFPRDRECYVPRVPDPGSAFQAKGCWNLDTESVPEGCDTVAFEYGKDTKVTLSAKPPAPTIALRKSVALTNTGDAPIQVVKGHCGSQGWFELDMGMQMSINSFCACPCADEFKPGTCAVCGDCGEDELQTLQPGESVFFAWDGQFAYQYESGCSKRYVMPTGTEVQGRFCWTTQGQSEPTCRGFGFPLADGIHVMAY